MPIQTGQPYVAMVSGETPEELAERLRALSAYFSRDPAPAPAEAPSSLPPNPPQADAARWAQFVASGDEWAHRFYAVFDRPPRGEARLLEIAEALGRTPVWVGAKVGAQVSKARRFFGGDLFEFGPGTMLPDGRWDRTYRLNPRFYPTTD